MRLKGSLFAKIFGFLAILALAILPWVKQNLFTHAGAVSSITAVAADTTKSASTTYTITFTPATAAAESGFISVSFWAPPDSKVGVGSATLGTGSSSIFQEISNRDTEHGAVGLTVSSIPTSEVTLKLENMVNPSKEGKYTVEVQTHQGWSDLDRGTGSLTIGTMAVEGTVTIPGGAGAKGAYVEAQDKADFGQRFGAPTDADGGYGVGGLTAGKTYILNVYLNPDPNDDFSNTKGLTSPDAVEITYSGTVITQNFALKPATKTVSGTMKYANGTAVANGRISAMRTDGSGFNSTQTDSAGAYSLSMGGGSYEIRPDTWAGPGQTPPDYAYSGPGTWVKFAKDDTTETKTGINFTVVKASATITGSVTPKPSGFAGVGIHNRGGFGTGTGIDPTTGAFSAKVPAGTYEIDIFSDPFGSGDKYMMPAMDPVTVSENETKNLGVITLVKMDKAINATVKDSASGVGLANFGIGCFRPRGGGFSMGRTDSSGNASVPVIAGDWGCMAMAGFGKEGGGPEDGGGPGALLERLISKVYAAAGQEKKYVVMGGPQFVTVGATPPTVNFQAVEANRAINVVTVDSSGNTISIHGFVEAQLVGSDLGDEFDKGGGLGQPIDPMMPGMAQLHVPAGIYDLFMMTPPGSDYSAGDPTRVDVTSGDANATLVLLPNDSTIQGTLYDDDGAVVTNVFVMIAAVNAKGSFIPGDANPSTGTYSMRVPSAAGTLRMGYFVDPATGYFPQSSTGTVTPVANQTHTFNITMKKATATLTVTVNDPSGNPVAGAFVEANNKQTDRDSKMDFFFHHGEKTDSNGQVSLLLPDGSYIVEAFLPPEVLRNNKWMPPKGTSITLVKNDSQTATLQFQSANVELKGKITKSDGTGVAGATVTAYSEDNEAIHTETNGNGDYTVNITTGDWHVMAEKDEGTDPYLSDNTAFATGDSTTVTQDLAVSKIGTLSASQVRSFDTDNATSVTVTGGSLDGAKIEAPADALDMDGNGSSATLNIASTVEMPLQKGNIPMAAGLEISAANSQGQAITSTNSNVSITIPVDKGEFIDNGYTVEDIGKEVMMSYWDDQNGTWVPVEGSQSAMEKDINGDGDTDDRDDQIWVTGATSHFTTFAVTSSADTTPPSAPTGISATAGAAKVTLSWTNPTDSDLAGIKIYRSTASGTVGDLVTTISSTTTTSYENTGLTNGTKYYYVVRSYDTSGNISTNTSQVNATPAELPATGQEKGGGSTLWLLLLALPALVAVRRFRLR